ncbi:aminotransferase class I/II-fold pyridoxal phosphate-dependent enzyme [Streptomyces sp. CoT10]|uniref:aminotransferase class I/II-fold pyridoxal phosphate-dependent enzyme n=1 Tax=Streptomyces sp. CoT10 TaxID=2875762 RepID=UPI0035A82D7D
MFQYGRTKGFIHRLIASQLQQDETLVVDPESVVVTTGCQEAMVLALRVLRRDARDVVLAALPAYVGFLGAARLVDMPVRGASATSWASPRTSGPGSGPWSTGISTPR